MEEIGLERFNLLSLDNSHPVRIISAANSLPPKTQYLTLSHRWATPQGISLSKETSFLLTEDISPYLLNCSEAAVFRHAIHVTRALGFRYLWIDALCIAQDDGAEKTSEIMHMDEIYFDAVLNISATEGRVREGLIFERRMLRTNPVRPSVTVPDTQDDVHLQVFPEKWSLHTREGALNSRGWVFQERTLAPRIVHFTRDQVFWECRSLEASEVLPQGVSDQEPVNLDKHIGLMPASVDVQKVKSKWYELLEAYTHTSLSFFDDRLLAISAVAKRFCAAMRLDPSDYLAGMWKIDLPQSMLWSQEPLLGRNGPEPASIEREMKHAPSWSWASIMAPARTIELSSLVPVAEVLCVEVARLSPNFFGGTDFCRLRLCGPICKFRRQFDNGMPWIHVRQEKVFQEFHDFDFQRGKAIVIDWDTCRKVTADEFFLLHIASEPSDDGRMERGLVLQRTAERGTFVRVAAFFTPSNSEYTGSRLEAAFTGRLHTLDNRDYLDCGLGGTYTIDII